METYLDKWEESYGRYENFIFYPKEEYVKFLNRFVRKKIGADKFVDILDFSQGVKALDYGCGIGRLTILMREFGIDSFGVDISSKAILHAKELAGSGGFADMDSKFSVIDGRSIPYPENFFDLAISEGVLDSMHFDLAKGIVKELERVTKKMIFISLISGDDSDHYREFAGEEIVKTKHEEGTIQSYYNFQKILELIARTTLRVKWCRLITEESVTDKYKTGRYYVLFSK